MSEQAQILEAHAPGGPAAPAGGAKAERHSYLGYIIVAVVLTTITVVEILIPSVSAITEALGRTWSVTALLLLSFVKGAGVVMYYMHLRHDNRLFAALFAFPFLIATTIVIILFLFSILSGA